MRATAAAMVAAMLAAGSPASADLPRGEAGERAAAERAVAAFRNVSYLPTDCEAAFRRFWTLYLSPGEEGLLREPYVFSPRDWFGWGNLAAAPLLEEAQRVCAAQTGARGDLVVEVLRKRQEAREAREARKREALPLIKGY